MLIDGIDPMVEICLNCEKPKCTGVCDEALQKAANASRSVSALTLTYQDKTLTIRQWADLLGLQRSTIYRRMERGLTVEQIFHRKATTKAKPSQINRTYFMLSCMAVNYSWYTNHPAIMGDSHGLVALYGKIKTAPTNKISDPTMHQALTELHLTEDELEAVLWIRCVQSVIEMYLNPNNATRHTQPIRRMRAEILRRRAFDGWTLKRIADYFTNDGTPMQLLDVKKHYDRCVEDVSNLAVSNGLVSDQK